MIARHRFSLNRTISGSAEKKKTCWAAVETSDEVGFVPGDQLKSLIGD